MFRLWLLQALFVNQFLLAIINQYVIRILNKTSAFAALLLTIALFPDFRTALFIVRTSNDEGTFFALEPGP